MRVMTLLRSAGDFGAPPPELFAALAELGEELKAAGVPVDTAGLAPTAVSPLVTLSGDAVSVTEGFSSAGSPDAFAIYDVASVEEAVAWAGRFLETHRRCWPGWSGEVEVRQTFGG
ncbi:hypothetical protein [Actinocorallia longicatena]|uniref:YCII-related domain-containing protein n=1 Tax=Actinocorallia longicatena TaxID=111803 RepID=A0ABP6QG48_9ACTN